jgi:hypothetical protein
MADLEETPIIEEQLIIQKPKKPRSQAQIDATQKMLLAKSQKREQDLQIKREQEEKLKAEEERIQKKLEEKIVKKAINIKKKRQTEEELIDLITDFEPELESKPIPTLQKAKKVIPVPAHVEEVKEEIKPKFIYR